MTIYDIAKEAGVSASTVSRVVNHKPGVNAETKRRIQELLDKYDYAPNETARGLVMQNNRMIGVLIRDIRNLHYTAGAYIVEQEYLKQGYHSIFLNTGGSFEAQAEAIRSLKQRRVAGAVLIGSAFQNEAVENAVRQYLPETPVVMVNGYLDLPNICGIITDEREGVRELVRHFVSKGHRKPVFFNLEDTPSNRLKIEGFAMGLADAGSDEPMVAQLDLDAGGLSVQIQDFLSAHPDRDGAIFSDDFVACVGGKAIAALGRKVPEQMIYAGINNSPFGIIASPTITSLDNKLEQVCMMAAQRLEDMMDGRSVERKTVISASICARESTGEADGPAAP